MLWGERPFLCCCRRRRSCGRWASRSNWRGCGESCPLKLVAEREGISCATLRNVEKGSPSVSIGIYASVLHALNNMDSDLLLIAKDDELGRKLQDLDLLTRGRAPKRGDGGYD